MRKSVCKRRLACVRLADNRNADFFLFFAFFNFRKVKLLDEHFRKLVDSVAMFCTDKDKLVKAVLIKIVGFFFPSAAFSFVYSGYNLAPVRAQKRDKFFVFGGYCSGFKQKQNQIGCFKRGKRFFNNKLVKHCFHCANLALKLKTACVHYAHRIAAYKAVFFNRVARNTRSWVCNCAALVQKAVEQRRLAHIRAACNHYFGKILIFFVLIEKRLLFSRFSIFNVLDYFVVFYHKKSF